MHRRRGYSGRRRARHQGAGRGPTFHERGILQTMDHPTVKGYVMPAWPVRHNGAPIAVKPSPPSAQHSAEVLESWLGLGARDIDGLAQDKIIGQSK